MIHPINESRPLDREPSGSTRLGSSQAAAGARARRDSVAERRHVDPEVLREHGRVGQGSLAVEVVHNRSTLVSSRATAPLKLLTPRASGPCVWSFAGTFGGGLLAGDDVSLDVGVGPGAALLIGTQASTKIYRSPNRLPARQSLRAAVAPGGTLLAIPDPVCPYADAAYEQRQTFAVADRSASLVLLDWLTSGRAARGERWAFSKYASRNAILVADQPLITDALTLDATDDLPTDARHRAGARDCLATLIAVGPAARGVADRVLTRVASEPLAVAAPVLAAASPLGDGGCVLRLMGGSVEAVAAYLKPLLSPVATIAGDDPWSRKF